MRIALAMAVCSPADGQSGVPHSHFSAGQKLSPELAQADSDTEWALSPSQFTLTRILFVCLFKCFSFYLCNTLSYLHH